MTTARSVAPATVPSVPQSLVRRLPARTITLPHAAARLTAPTAAGQLVTAVVPTAALRDQSHLTAAAISILTPPGELSAALPVMTAPVIPVTSGAAAAVSAAHLAAGQHRVLI